MTRGEVGSEGADLPPPRANGWKFYSLSGPLPCPNPMHIFSYQRSMNCVSEDGFLLFIRRIDFKSCENCFFTEKRLLRIQRENGKAYEITEDYQHLWPLIVGLGSEIIMQIMTKYFC